MQQCCSSAGRCTWFAIGRLTWRTLRTPLPKCTEPWILSLFLLSSLRMLTKEGGLKKRGETFSTNVSFVVNSFSLEGSRLSPSHDTNNMNNSMMKFIFFFIFLVYHRLSSLSSSSSRWEDLEKSWTRCYNSWTKEDDRTKSKRYVFVCAPT